MPSKCPISAQPPPYSRSTIPVIGPPKQFLKKWKLLQGAYSQRSQGLLPGWFGFSFPRDPSPVSRSRTTFFFTDIDVILVGSKIYSPKIACLNLPKSLYVSVEARKAIV
jgi:hypothetical protein